ncbi:MAG: hypothetical protein AAGF78_11215 [Pseudomonadota bacterium]
MRLALALGVMVAAAPASADHMIPDAGGSDFDLIGCLGVADLADADGRDAQRSQCIRIIEGLCAWGMVGPPATRTALCLTYEARQMEAYLSANVDLLPPTLQPGGTGRGFYARAVERLRERIAAYADPASTDDVMAAARRSGTMLPSSSSTPGDEHTLSDL